jgi:copper chaperone CopZ
VESSIKSINSNVETSIDLASGKVQIRGLNLDELAIKEKIEGRGFTVES